MFLRYSVLVEEVLAVGLGVTAEVSGNGVESKARLICLAALPSHNAMHIHIEGPHVIYMRYEKGVLVAILPPTIKVQRRLILLWKSCSCSISHSFNTSVTSSV